MNTSFWNSAKGESRVDLAVPFWTPTLLFIAFDFFSSPTSDIPPAPNVDPFNFDAIKVKVFEQLDAFSGIPFTVQRLAELITSPRKHYKRTDKFMRALEKNMLVRWLSV